MRTYHVADARGFIKLDAMENPYGWPEALQKQWLGVLEKAALNLYPDPQATRLRTKFQPGHSRFPLAFN